MCSPHSMWHPPQTALPVPDLSTVPFYSSALFVRLDRRGHGSPRAYENTDREMICLLEKDLARRK